MENKVTSCDGCSACCLYCMVRVQTKGLTEEEIRWYAMHGIEARVNGLLMNVPCKNVDMEKRRCKIYETRPKCCREAKVGDKNCLYSRLHMKGLGVKIDDADDKKEGTEERDSVRE
jgi:Fe-S-cluster containining protein